MIAGWSVPEEFVNGARKNYFELLHHLDDYVSDKIEEKRGQVIDTFSQEEEENIILLKHVKTKVFETADLLGYEQDFARITMLTFQTFDFWKTINNEIDLPEENHKFKEMIQKKFVKWIQEFCELFQNNVTDNYLECIVKCQSIELENGYIVENGSIPVEFNLKSIRKSIPTTVYLSDLEKECLSILSILDSFFDDQPNKQDAQDFFHYATCGFDSQNIFLKNVRFGYSELILFLKDDVNDAPPKTQTLLLRKAFRLREMCKRYLSQHKDMSYPTRRYIDFESPDKPDRLLIEGIKKYVPSSLAEQVREASNRYFSLCSSWSDDYHRVNSKEDCYNFFCFFVSLSKSLEKFKERKEEFPAIYYGIKNAVSSLKDYFWSVDAMFPERFSETELELMTLLPHQNCDDVIEDYYSEAFSMCGMGFYQRIKPTFTYFQFSHFGHSNKKMKEPQEYDCVIFKLKKQKKVVVQSNTQSLSEKLSRVYPSIGGSPDIFEVTSSFSDAARYIEHWIYSFCVVERNE